MFHQHRENDDKLKNHSTLGGTDFGGQSLMGSSESDMPSKGPIGINDSFGGSSTFYDVYNSRRNHFVGIVRCVGGTNLFGE